jgi:hypothetical protein
MKELYKIVYNDETDGDLYGISIVDNPANLYDFLTLSKEGRKVVNLQVSDSQKRLLTGVVLIPNQRIPRVNKDGSEYEIYFDEPVIERLSQDFLTKGYQRNTTYNHDDKLWLDGTSVVESWLIVDPKNDKANALNFKGLPMGTWMITMKLSQPLWDEYITTGVAKGFSIDSYIQMEKVLMNAQAQVELAQAIDANPDAISEQDNELFKVRYKYSPSGTSLNSRDFCIRMTTADLVYRKEDILTAGSVNPGFGPNGSDYYNLFKYKGGVNCRHAWLRQIYLNKNNATGMTLKEALDYIGGLSKADAVKAILEVNPSEVSQTASSANNHWRLSKENVTECNCSVSNQEEVPSEIIDTFITKGEGQPSDNWILIDQQEVDDLILSINEEVFLPKNVTKLKLKKKKMSMLKKLIEMFSADVKLATMMVEGFGNLTADAFELDNVVYQETEGEQLPLVSQTFEYEGYTYTTDETGKIVEKVEVVQEEVEPEMEPATEVEPVEMNEASDAAIEEIMTVAEDIAIEVEQPIEQIDIDKLLEKIDILSKQLEIITQERDSVLNLNAELSAKPKDTRLKANQVKSKGAESTMEALSRIVQNK